MIIIIIYICMAITIISVTCGFERKVGLSKAPPPLRPEVAQLEWNTASLHVFFSEKKAVLTKWHTSRWVKLREKSSKVILERHNARASRTR